MRTLIKFDNGLNSGKWLLIRTQLNKLKKSFFQKKPRESFHPNLYFNKFVFGKVQTQKHLELKLDKKLGLKKHLKDKFAKVNREIGILKKTERILTTPFINYSLQILFTASPRLRRHYL